MQELYASRRVENYNREHGIKAADQAMEQREANRFESARVGGTGARRNQGGESYNILTQDYNRSSGGQSLENKVCACARGPC